MSQTAFNQAQFDAIYPRGIEKHYWNSARNRIIHHWLIKHGKKSAKMLEVGCGKGIVVEYLRNHGVNCFGVETAPIVPLAPVNSFIKTGIDHASMDEEFRRSIDTVLLFDVIEHVPDEAVFINSIRTAFPNLKMIVATVPARMELWSNYDEYNGHFRRHSIKTLKQLSNKLSVSFSNFSYLFHELYLPALILILLLRKRDTQISAPNGWKVFIHKLLSDYFFLDYLLIPRQVLGTSILFNFDLNQTKIYKNI